MEFERHCGFFLSGNSSRKNDFLWKKPRNPAFNFRKVRNSNLLFGRRAQFIWKGPMPPMGMLLSKPFVIGVRSRFTHAHIYQSHMASKEYDKGIILLSAFETVLSRMINSIDSEFIRCEIKIDWKLQYSRKEYCRCFYEFLFKKFSILYNFCISIRFSDDTVMQLMHGSL